MKRLSALLFLLFLSLFFLQGGSPSLYSKDSQTLLLYENLEALINPDEDVTAPDVPPVDVGWYAGFRTEPRRFRNIHGVEVEIPCCVPSSPTDACNFDEVGCITGNIH